MFIKPWNEESENILRRLSAFGRAKTNNLNLPRDFSKRSEIRQLCDLELLCISNNRKKKISWFTVSEEAFVVPHNTKKGLAFEFKWLKF